MPHSNILTVCLVAASLLLFLYTFSHRAEMMREAQSLNPSRLPLEPEDRQGSMRKTLSSSSSSHSLFDPHVVALFKQQAAQRKSMFESALNQLTPKVSAVLLPIVAEAYCPSLVRVGSVGDGGKWVCNPWAMPKGGLVFSLGSNSDISFERDFQEATGQAAKILTVDMNAASKNIIDGLAENNAKFVQAKIADKTELNKSPPHYTVQDLMRKEGHDHIEILKMDIEGAETAVLPQFLTNNSVCQIIVEIHNIYETPKLLRAVANSGFLLQKYELNAFWTATGLCEYSFIHESCMEKYGATLLASYLKQ